MLVTFKTNSYADITMFGDAAKTLLKMMGMSGEVPGAMMGPDVAGALAALQSELAKSEPAPESADKAEPAAVSDSTRAAPLMELLEAAKASGDNVTWDT